MKNTCLLLFVLFVSATTAQGQETYLNDMKKKWKNATAYSLEVAELMPEADYDYKPAEDIRTFREQLLHSLQNMIWLSSTYMSTNKFEGDLKKEDYSKAEMIQLMKDAFAFSAKAVDDLEAHDLRMQVKFFAGPMTVRQTLTLMNDHLTHHRGQIIIYLRMKGIKPPRYVGW